MESHSSSSSSAIVANNKTFLGLNIYTVIAISVVGVVFVVATLLLLVCLCARIRRRRVIHTTLLYDRCGGYVAEIQTGPEGLIEDCKVSEKRVKDEGGGTPIGGGNEGDMVVVVVGNVLRSSSQGLLSPSPSMVSSLSSEVVNIGWGRWYTLRELEIATSGFCEENVIGEGGYESLLDKKGQAEKVFKVEVEAIGKVRYKNLVGLIGYCAEGTQRILVYEYVDNGNLEQWLQGNLGPVSPLTWDIRMKIAVGTAKGLAYLHEGLEPKVVHRDIKSSNILLDKKWNSKVSDFGLAKFLGPDASHVTTRVIGTFGCVAPKYASTGMLNEGSDVYSFEILLMEIISGRNPVDYARPPREVNLVEWFKSLVASRRGYEVVDPLIDVQPSPRALKWALLVCLRCIDLDAKKRPKMGQVVHMLEGVEFPFHGENRPG
ncbi:hypothetical protein GIB67_006735 [Kingdonia uniflora]|uniref:non-specific serine/threonine protein kinase n=1 Tax=Kingdonia uniflora TaxID=39325 RepID=A0A7J7LYU9_9MAGN|nr:hypothetical protein GIB67_006735 [Kingdonia uniflora]